MKLSFSKTKKYDRFSPNSRHINSDSVQQSAKEIAKSHNLSEPYMYESAIEEDFTDFDSIKKTNK